MNEAKNTKDWDFQPMSWPEFKEFTKQFCPGSETHGGHVPDWKPVIKESGIASVHNGRCRCGECGCNEEQWKMLVFRPAEPDGTWNL